MVHASSTVVTGVIVALGCTTLAHSSPFGRLGLVQTDDDVASTYLDVKYTTGEAGVEGKIMREEGEVPRHMTS